VDSDVQYVERLRKLVESDGRYHLEAVIFLHEALETTIKMVGKQRHVTGRELLEGVRRLALERHGMMARVLFESWGVRTTGDIGEIVFLLVENGVWGRTETDDRRDFKDVYDLKEVFENAFEIG